MSDAPRVGFLTRTDDVTGLSGTGRVAWLVEFPDGPCVVRWCVSDVRQTAVFANLADVLAVHGHDGRTEPEWAAVATVRPRRMGGSAGPVGSPMKDVITTETLQLLDNDQLREVCQLVVTCRIGASSAAMLHHAIRGTDVPPWLYPCDASDLGRCTAVLAAAPAWLAHRMSGIYDQYQHHAEQGYPAQ